ncbi:MAG: hypothetical protein Q4G14_01630 [Paracoccus sp. (in: a-proteobacteria)]|nr:hypothetical protein [Paracoccus sp. (in: a-proteobacteria)]MDO5611926.1 hypothetical protein [Paracoccus sp. (in: a-proteobacteria)]
MVLTRVQVEDQGVDVSFTLPVDRRKGLLIEIKQEERGLGPLQ